MFSRISRIFLLSAVLFLSFHVPVTAQEDFVSEKVEVHFFDDRLCSVCKDTKDFIFSLQDRYSQLDIKIYSISDTKKLAEVAQEKGVGDYRVMAPAIFIGNNFFQFNDFTQESREKIIRAIEGENFEDDKNSIKIPFLNIEVDMGNWSLPLLAFILGSIDGLNVCSVGALVLVLYIVLVFDSRKKILLFGFLFILTVVLVYGVMVFAWGKLFELLVGQLEILRIIVGLAALAGGIYFFKDFWRFFKYGPTCKASNSKLIAKATENLQKVFENPNQKFYLLASGVMFFAAVVTIVELPCSIGIPVAFAGILVERSVSLGAYIFYILFYLFFYMLIEIIVFTGAVLTKKIWFSNSKIVTWVTFAGAVVLFYLAFYYLIGF